MKKVSNFTYLEKEFPLLFNIAQSAEFNLHQDPVTTIFKLRLFGEKLTELIFEENYLEFPYENSFHSRLKTLQFENILPERVKDLLFTIKNKGNLAVHGNKGSIDDAKLVLFAAFKVAKWFYQIYANEKENISQLKYSLPENLDARHALHVLEGDYKLLEDKFQKLIEEREIKEQSKKERAAIVKLSEKVASKIDMTEAETRVLIDDQLRQAGWEVETEKLNFKKNKTLPQKGKNMAIAE